MQRSERWKSIQTEVRRKTGRPFTKTEYPASWPKEPHVVSAQPSLLDEEAALANPRRLVGGLDLSSADATLKDQDEDERAIGTLVVTDSRHLDIPLLVLHQPVILKVPYEPSFLAFREVPVYLELLKQCRLNYPDLYPELLFVDGHAGLHPLELGSAAHLEALLPKTAKVIGIGKQFYPLPNGAEWLSSQKGMTKACRQHLKIRGQYLPIPSAVDGHRAAGAALLNSAVAQNTIFVSPASRLTLEEAVDLALFVSKYRVPEPIRLADFESRKEVSRVKSSDAVWDSCLMVEKETLEEQSRAYLADPS